MDSAKNTSAVIVFLPFPIPANDKVHLAVEKKETLISCFSDVSRALFSSFPLRADRRTDGRTDGRSDIIVEGPRSFLLNESVSHSPSLPPSFLLLSVLSILSLEGVGCRGTLAALETRDLESPLPAGHHIIYHPPFLLQRVMSPHESQIKIELILEASIKKVPEGRANRGSRGGAGLFTSFLSSLSNVNA